MATTYNVYRDGEKVANGLTTKEYKDTNLTPATTYEYYITAENEHGESRPSDTVEVTTDEPHEPPEEPGGVRATSKTDTEVNLEWE